MVAMAASRASAGSPGESRSRRRCWPGARADGFNVSRPAFTGGNAVGQWRRTPPAFGPMSAQGLAYHRRRSHWSTVRSSDLHLRAVCSGLRPTRTTSTRSRHLGRKTGSTRTADQTALAPFWEGNASVHWNQAANQIARANHLSMSASNRLARRLEHRDGRYRIHYVEWQANLRRSILRRSRGGR